MRVERFCQHHAVDPVCWLISANERLHGRSNLLAKTMVHIENARFNWTWRCAWKWSMLMLRNEASTCKSANPHQVPKTQIALGGTQEWPKLFDTPCKSYQVWIGRSLKACQKVEVSEVSKRETNLIIAYLYHSMRILLRVSAASVELLSISLALQLKMFISVFKIAQPRLL